MWSIHQIEQSGGVVQINTGLQAAAAMRLEFHGRFLAIRPAASDRLPKRFFNYLGETFAGFRRESLGFGEQFVFELDCGGHTGSIT